MVVGPTKTKPRFFSAFDSATDSGEVVATPSVVRGAGWSSGRKPATNASRPPESRSATVARGVGDRGVDLEPVADDAGVGHQPRPVGVVERRDGVGVEAGEGGPEVLALGQDRAPRQPGLERLERQPLEVGAPRP